MSIDERMPVDVIPEDTYKSWEVGTAVLLKRVTYFLGFSGGATAKEIFLHCSGNRFSYNEFIYQLTRFAAMNFLDKDKIGRYNRYYNRREGPYKFIDAWRENLDSDVIDLIYVEKHYKYEEKQNARRKEQRARSSADKRKYQTPPAWRTTNVLKGGFRTTSEFGHC